MNRDGIIQIVEEYYGALYSCKEMEPDSPNAADLLASSIERMDTEYIPPILANEKHLSRMEFMLRCSRQEDLQYSNHLLNSSIKC
ncbi:unnamed protein product [Arctia plantaginis]|uniref:Uncharacterized protein n=1 Tax=Arctia plantaginis TaxID=874455 RepID=A0A8S1AB53_ARCPL|nr:unnamed protein product [Arctia plantaginis]